MFNDETYDSDYKEKFRLFLELMASRFGKATEQSEVRQKLSRIQLKGNATNTISLDDTSPTDLGNVMVVSVRSDSVVNQVYIDLDTIELILADGSLQDEFFAKIASVTSSIYTVKEKQVDHLGLLFRFIK